MNRQFAGHYWFVRAKQEHIPLPAYLVQFWGKGIHAHQLGTVVSGEPFNFRVWRNKKVHMVSVGGSINQNWCQRFTRLWEQRTLATIQCLDLAIFSFGPQKTMKWSNGDKTNKVGCRKKICAQIIPLDIMIKKITSGGLLKAPKQGVVFIQQCSFYSL